MIGSPTDRNRYAQRCSMNTLADVVLKDRYMSYIRQPKPRQKAQIRKTREAKGVRAAIQRTRIVAKR